MINIEQTIKAIVENQSGEIVTDLNQDLRDSLGLDSLDIVEIIMNIDKAFNVTTPDEVWETVKVATVQDMVTVVTNFLNDNKER